MSNIAQMSAKERIFSLLDDNSFVEIGALVTKRSTDFNLQEKVTPADGVITGYGTIKGKLNFVYSQDVTALNGSIGEMHAKKITKIYDLALKVGAPVIGLIDCAGLRLQEATDALNGFGELYLKQTLASGVILQLSVILGSCGGGVAISTVLSDFTFMTEKTSKLFVNSPNVLEGNYIGKCDTSSSDFQSKAGVVDVVEDDERCILDKVRELITILPSNNKDSISLEECKDDLNRMLTLTDVERRDSRRFLRELSDESYYFELKEKYASELVTAFILLGGKTVGVVANTNELHDENGNAVEKYETTLTTNGCLKAERFIKLCDTFGVPILTLTNTTGFRATVEEEKTIAIASAKLTYAFANATVPKVNVITGKAFGSAYITMNSKHIGADLVYAYRNSEIGMMEAKLATQIIYEEEIKASDNPIQVINEKEEEYRALQASSESAAKRGYIDNIIEVESTRKHLIYAFDLLFSKRESRPSKKHGTI